LLNRPRRIGATVRVAAFAYRPGNGMTKANTAKALPAAMVTPFVVAAASVPSVMVTAPAMSTAVVAMSMLDLNHATIRCRHRANTQPGGSRQAHRQRSK
jgi:hypothetical protein